MIWQHYFNLHKYNFNSKFYLSNMALTSDHLHVDPIRDMMSLVAFSPLRHLQSLSNITKPSKAAEGLLLLKARLKWVSKYLHANSKAYQDTEQCVWKTKYILLKAPITRVEPLKKRDSKRGHIRKINSTTYLEKNLCNTRHCSSLS